MNSLRPKLAIVASTLLIFLTGACASGSKMADASLPPGTKRYPLKTCVVMGEKLDKDAYVFVYEGQQIKLCCESCKDDFNKDPQKYLKKLAGK